MAGDVAGLSRIEVDAIEGALTAPIDSEYLQFRYPLDSDPPTSCLLTYTEAIPTRPFPEVGALVRGRTNELVRNHTGSCHDFLFQEFKYRFSGRAAVDVDYLPLTVELEDGRGPPVSETVYLKVFIRGGEPNSAPTLRVNRSHVPVVRQPTSLRLNGEMLSVVDRETEPRNVLINVTSRLDPREDGFFARTHDHTRPITAFRFDELADRRIAFRPPSRPLTEELELGIELVAVDSHFTLSAPSRIILRVRAAPSSTALRVLRNRGLVVPEGGRQPVTLDDLDFVDAAGRRPGDVQLSVKSGLRRGHLEVNGQRTTEFSLRDVERKKVTYRHHDGNSLDDRVALRANSGRHFVRVRFPIVVLPVDDRAPSLAGAGESLVVPRGGYAQVGRRHLNAVDRQTSDRRRIVFQVLDQPEAGEIRKRISPLTGGRRVSTFTQLDVDRGLVYYRHRGGESGRDRVDYWIGGGDSAVRSGRLSLQVRIAASGNLPPHEMEGTERAVAVAESSGAVLGKDRLWYEDVEDRSDSVLYTVTRQPFYPSARTTTDAGRLVLLDGMDDPADSYGRLSRAQPLFEFTQTDVNEGRVAYVAPKSDIGPSERHCRFAFAVTDSHGTSIMDQVSNVPNAAKRSRPH